MKKDTFKNRFKKNRAFIITFLVELIAYVAFGLSLFNRWEVVLYISGIIIMICLTAIFIIPLIKRERIDTVDWVGMMISFVIFVVLLSFYIAAIPNTDLKQTVLTLSAATIGGLLTLTGVVITIKYNRVYKEEDDIEKLKPHIFVIGEERWDSIPNDKKSEGVVYFTNNSDSCKSVEVKNEIIIKNIRLANSDLSLCVLRGLLINDEIFPFKYETVLPKDSYSLLCSEKGTPLLWLSMDEKLNEIYLLAEDILQHQYKIKLGFVRDKKDERIIKIMGAFNPEEFEF